MAEITSAINHHPLFFKIIVKLYHLQTNLYMAFEKIKTAFKQFLFF